MKRAQINNLALSRGTGVSHVTIGNYLKGTLPKSEHLVALANYFGVSTDEILGREGMDQGGAASAMHETASESDLALWRRRAKSSEKRLSDLQRGLRSLLEKSSSSPVTPEDVVDDLLTDNPRKK